MTKPFLLLLYPVLALSFCACITQYRYTADVSKDIYTNRSPAGWKGIDKNNHIVLHSGDEMMELYDVTYEEQGHLISGKLRPFEGPALAAYNEISDYTRNQKIKREKGKIAKQAVKQVHLNLTDEYDLTNEEITFRLDDVYLINESKNSIALGSVILFTATVLTVGLYLSLYLAFG